MNTQGWIRGTMAKNMEEEKFLYHVVDCFEREFEMDSSVEREEDIYLIRLGSYETQVNASNLRSLKLKGAYCLDAYLLD